MTRQREIARFLLRLVVLFCLFQASWPILGNTYGIFLRAMASLYLGQGDARRELSLEEIKTTHADTRVVIVNRSLMAADGSGPIRNLDINARGLSWRPTCLLAALILASSVPWKRRILALGVGLLLQQIAFLSIVGFCVWVESSEIGLVEFSPFGKRICLWFRGAILNQITLAIPVLIWLFVTFRKRDLLWATPEGKKLPGQRASKQLHSKN